MTFYDVAIIGGGLAGCSAALHLRQRGASVVLLERGRCGAQASGVNFGGVRQQGRHLAELPIARRSRAIWPRLPELIGIDGEFRATGHLKLARSEAEMAELEGYAETARPYGLTLDLLSRTEIKRRYPYLSGVAVGGSFCAEDGQANPRLVAPAFARAARKLGADIREETEVVAATLGAGGFHIRTAAGQSVRAGRLLNMAGAWPKIQRFTRSFEEVPHAAAIVGAELFHETINRHFADQQAGQAEKRGQKVGAPLVRNNGCRGQGDGCGLNGSIHGDSPGER